MYTNHEVPPPLRVSLIPIGLTTPWLHGEVDQIFRLEKALRMSCPRVIFLDFARSFALLYSGSHVRQLFEKYVAGFVQYPGTQAGASQNLSWAGLIV